MRLPAHGNIEPYDCNPIYWQKTEFEHLESDGCWLSITPDKHTADWGSITMDASEHYNFYYTKTFYLQFASVKTKPNLILKTIKYTQNYCSPI